MPNRKLSLRDCLIFTWVGLTYHLGRLIALCGLALLLSWTYAAHLVGLRTAFIGGWNFLLLAVSATLLGAALWLRERRADKAFKEDCRRAREQCEAEDDHK